MRKRLLRASGQMTCARACALLPLHVAGDLPAGRAAVLARHLRTCANCRGQADEYAASRAWLQAGAQPVFADEFYADIRAAVLRQIKQEQTPAAPQPTPFFAALFSWRALYVAASVALLCMAGALAWQVYSKRQPQPQIMATGTRSEQVPMPAPKATASPAGTPRTPSTPYRTMPNNDQTVRDQFVASAQRLRRVRRIAQTERALMPLPTQHDESMPVQTALTANAATPSMEVARIELQTADPNIRIIWLAQQPADTSFTKDR